MMLPNYCDCDISTAPRAFLLTQGLHPGAKASAPDFARLRPKWKRCAESTYDQTIKTYQDLLGSLKIYQDLLRSIRIY